MATGAPIHTNMLPRPMPTNSNILTLTQWFSPAYPIGAFAYSHGLEAAVLTGQITNGPALQDWLSDLLDHGSGRNDCTLLRAAFNSPDGAALAHLNATFLAFAASAERQQEVLLQGAAFCKTTQSIWGGPEGAYAYPIAVGAAAARAGLDVELTAAMYLQAMMSNLISAALRLMPLGQTEGQLILAALTPLCERLARDTEGARVDDLSSIAFLSDIAAMQHETLQPRIFRS